jgi:GGDEF domain-containing protein
VEPGKLDVRKVSTLRISSHGRTAARAGQIEESFAAFDGLNCVVPNYFRHMLDWAIVTRARHEAFHFELMLIEFLNTAELIDHRGASRTFLLLDEFARRLQELLRESDVLTRTDEQRMWLFLPYTSTAGITQRLQKGLSELDTRDGPALKVRIRALPALPGVSAEDLMARLQADS